MVNLPEGHPAHILAFDLDDDSDETSPELDVFMTGGRRESDTSTLRHWRARAEVAYDYPSIENPNVPVASMSAIIVQPYMGHPWDDLDHIDGDAEALGSVFFDGQMRSDAFMDIAEGYGEPVVLISNYTVVPEWRGTIYSTFIAARMLSIFADMGVTAAALQASPAGFGGSEVDRQRICSRLSGFWQGLGFSALEGNPEFMASPLTPYDSAALVSNLIREYDLPFTARDD